MVATNGAAHLALVTIAPFVIIFFCAVDAVVAQETIGTGTKAKLNERPHALFDSPNYVSPLGLTCSQHASLNCAAFGNIRFTVSEVQELMSSCRKSCEVGENFQDNLLQSFKGDRSYKRGNSMSTQAHGSGFPTTVTTGGVCFGGMCSDDSQFKTKLGLTCANHQDFDCSQFVSVGYSWEETYRLLSKCPCSCKTQCLPQQEVSAKEVAASTKPLDSTYTPNEPQDLDSDGDFILDSIEKDLGTNLYNPDSDGDGASDAEEVIAGTGPLDASVKPKDLNDSDSDGISDASEAALAKDGDGDGITNSAEETLGLNPYIPDSDWDGASDAEELAAGTDPLEASDKPKNLQDSDNDGVSDAVETALAKDSNEEVSPDTTEMDFGLNPYSPESNRDRSEEMSAGRDPLDAPDKPNDLDESNSDGDSEVTEAALALDSDGDWITDPIEKDFALDPYNPDSDGDGASDTEEVIARTDPLDASDKPQGIQDSDNDGVSDAVETALAKDSDGDGIVDSVEKTLGLDPYNLDSDGDGANDTEEAIAGTDPLDASDKPKKDLGLDPYSSNRDGNGASDAVIPTSTPSDNSTLISTDVPTMAEPSSTLVSVKAPVTDAPSTAKPSEAPVSASPTPYPSASPVSPLPTSNPSTAPVASLPTSTPTAEPLIPAPLLFTSAHNNEHGPSQEVYDKRSSGGFIFLLLIILVAILCCLFTAYLCYTSRIKTTNKAKDAHTSKTTVDRDNVSKVDVVDIPEDEGRDSNIEEGRGCYGASTSTDCSGGN